jgi:hypothetical protein
MTQSILLLLLTILATTLISLSTSHIRKCATKPIKKEDIPVIIDHEIQWKKKAAKFAGPTYFNLVFNVITAPGGVYNVPTQNILAQINVLNRAYAGLDRANGLIGQIDTNIRFRLAGINRYVHATRAATCGDEGAVDNAIMAAYKAKVPNVVNIYVCNLRDDILGYATLPCNGANSFNMFLKWDTLPAAPGSSYVPAATMQGVCFSLLVVLLFSCELTLFFLTTQKITLLNLFPN